jgi:hypothetical protein
MIALIVLAMAPANRKISNRFVNVKQIGKDHDVKTSSHQMGVVMISHGFG